MIAHMLKWNYKDKKKLKNNRMKQENILMM